MQIWWSSQCLEFNCSIAPWRSGFVLKSCHPDVRLFLLDVARWSVLSPVYALLRLAQVRSTITLCAITNTTALNYYLLEDRQKVNLHTEDLMVQSEVRWLITALYLLWSELYVTWRTIRCFCFYYQDAGWINTFK